MLPEPSFIDRDPAVITAELIALYEQLTGKTLYPAQPERLFIDLIAYRENLLRIAIQEAAKQNLVEYAAYPMLDYLGELVGTTRLAAQSARCILRFNLTGTQSFDVTVPAGTRVESKDGAVIFASEFDLTIAAGQAYGDMSAVCSTAGIAGNGYVTGEINNMLDVVANVASAANTTTTSDGSDEETDDAYRARIKLAPERFSNAGSRGAYRYHTLSVHQNIVDAAITSPSAGVVNVYPLTSTGNPDNAMLALVAAALTDEKVRPLTDQVNVLAPTRKAFTIDADITLYESADGATVQAVVEASLTAYSATQRAALGRDVVVSQIVAAINSISGVYKTVVNSPVADIVNADAEWSDCTAITVTIAGYVNG